MPYTHTQSAPDSVAILMVWNHKTEMLREENFWECSASIHIWMAIKTTISKDQAKKQEQTTTTKKPTTHTDNDADDDFISKIQRKLFIHSLSLVCHGNVANIVGCVCVFVMFFICIKSSSLPSSRFSLSFFRNESSNCIIQLKVLCVRAREMHNKPGNSNGNGKCSCASLFSTIIIIQIVMCSFELYSNSQYF